MSNRLNMLAAAVLSSLLVACGGGGGGGGSDNPSPAPEPTPETPTGSSGDSGTRDSANYTGDQLAAFEAINAARAQAGLAPVKQNTKLDEAAAGHVNYVVLNEWGGHNQTEGKPGYTGEWPEDRAKNASYHGLGGVGEIIGLEGDAAAIAGALSTIYHRVPLLRAEIVDIGIGQGIFTDTRDTPPTQVPLTVINTGTTAPGKHIANATGYWVWPFDGATGLRVRYGETPNPAPDLPTLGYAISVAVNPGDVISAEAFGLNCAGQDLPARLITAANDINGMVKPDWVFLQPEVALPYDATCTAVFQGSSQKLGRFNKTWSFTTTQAPLPAVPAP